jgi:hypothetical protein
VEGETCLPAQLLEQNGEKVGAQAGHVLAGEVDVRREKRSAGRLDDDLRQRLVRRRRRGAVAPAMEERAELAAERPADGLDLLLAAAGWSGLELEVEATPQGENAEEMVEDGKPRRDACLPAPSDQPDTKARLVGRGARRHGDGHLSERPARGRGPRQAEQRAGSRSRRMQDTRMSVTETILTTCPRDCYDACGIAVVKRGGTVVHVRGDPGHAVSRGRLCPKCSIGYNREWRDPAARLTKPLVRVGPKGEGRFEAVSWNDAVETISSRLGSIAERHGANTILNAHYTGTI